MKTVRLSTPSLRNIGLHMALLFLGNANTLHTRDYYEIWQYEQFKRDIFKCANADGVTEKCFGAMLLSLFARTNSGRDVFLDPDEDDPYPVNGWELALQLSHYFLGEVGEREGVEGKGNTFKMVRYCVQMVVEMRKKQAI